MKRTHNTTPEWALRIASLRRRLHLSQTELGERLRCSAMTVSRWERGAQAPSAEFYIELGNLGGKADCWFFWRHAGLQTADLMRVLPSRSPRYVLASAFAHLDTAIAGSGGKGKTRQEARLVAIPLLKVSAGTHGEEGDKLLDLSEAPAEEMIAAPSQWCPNPAHTSCLRVKGHSMTPTIPDDAIVAVDSSQTDHSQLDNKIVVAWDAKKGLSISRFRRYRGVEVLEPENREYESVILSESRGWRIVGKVLWWIGKAP